MPQEVSKYQLKLGTATRWATLLPSSYALPTRPDIAAWLGYSTEGLPFHFGTWKGQHITEMMYSSLVRAGIQPKDGQARFRWYGGGPIVCGEGVHVEVPYVRLTTGPLEELETQLAECSLYVGIDSGPMCVADCMAVPTIGVFSSTNPARFGPIVNRHSLSLVRPSVEELTSKVEEVYGQLRI